MAWPFNYFVKKPPVRNVSDEPMSPIFTIAGQPVRFLTQGATMGAEEAQRSIPQLYRVTHLVASSAQAVPWYCGHRFLSSGRTGCASNTQGNQ